MYEKPFCGFRRINWYHTPLTTYPSSFSDIRFLQAPVTLSNDMRTPPRIAFSAALILATSLCNLVISESVHVSVKNRLGNGKSMNIHCQSKDTDLGQQTVTEGNEIGWDFSPNIWGTTLFFCDLGGENVQQYHFDAYSYARDSSRCDSGCSWLISAEGMYGFNEHTGFWEFMYDWSS